MATLRWNVFFFLGGLLVCFPAGLSNHEPKSYALFDPYLCIIMCFTASLPPCMLK